MDRHLSKLVKELFTSYVPTMEKLSDLNYEARHRSGLGELLKQRRSGKRCSAFEVSGISIRWIYERSRWRLLTCHLHIA
jgi:hypothetical protein